MKSLLSLFLLFFIIINLTAQHTFSIVAVDSVTNEIGSAGATCLPEEDGALWVSDIVLNVGAINTQAYWTPVNQNAATEQMESGLSPQEIIDWLVENDNSSQGGNISDRQYGIVDLNNGQPRAAAYTGSNNFDVKGQRVGKNYAIQGNILISEEVLDDMELAFLNTNGPLCDKLMASLQAAKRPGADVRCLNDGISSASAYVRVAKPTDTNSEYGNLWLDLNVWLDSNSFSGDPIDELQRKFDEFKETVAVDEQNIGSIKIFPNPTKSDIVLELGNTQITKVEFYNLLGNLCLAVEISKDDLLHSIDLKALTVGTYFVKFWNANILLDEISLLYKVE